MSEEIRLTQQEQVRRTKMNALSEKELTLLGKNLNEQQLPNQ